MQQTYTVNGAIHTLGWWGILAATSDSDISSYLVSVVLGIIQFSVNHSIVTLHFQKRPHPHVSMAYTRVGRPNPGSSEGRTD